MNLNGHSCYDSKRLADEWRTMDGVEIWRALALYQPCVQVLEGEAPMRVVLLQDYQALAQLLADTMRSLKSAQALQAKTAALTEFVPMLMEAIA